MSNEMLSHLATVFLLLIAYGILYLLLRKNTLYFVSSTMIGIGTFALMYVTNKNEVGVGTGLGLFAIFGILRYRTEQVPIIEMTYLFLSITMAVIIAMADNLILSFSQAVITDIIIMVMSLALFYIHQRNETTEVEVLVDSLDWMQTTEAEKLKFLQLKTMGNITGYRILYIDWLKETCRVMVTKKVH
ncbi:MAG: DUF4956 domain-containing protein [Ferruginibacter sp.]